MIEFFRMSDSDIAKVENIHEGTNPDSCYSNDKIHTRSRLLLDHNKEPVIVVKKGKEWSLVKFKNGAEAVVFVRYLCIVPKYAEEQVKKLKEKEKEWNRRTENAIK